ncbi:MAG: delta-60 repeat domain-containing protein, partial [Casimicrobiaceae bacterium]|nr:delta-60 repeat domain-containing protein [Casimicrobiaceae bacterium]
MGLGAFAQTPGSLDASFATGGKLNLPIGTSTDRLTKVLVQPDGRIILAGSCLIGASYDFCAARLTSTGTLDASFGTGGKQTWAIGSGNDSLTTAQLLPDGKLLLAGYCENAGDRDFCLARINPNGTLDASFGVGGFDLYSVGTSLDTARTLTILPDGRILVGGSCTVGGSWSFCFIRLLTDGSFDATFGTSGKVILSGAP